MSVPSSSVGQSHWRANFTHVILSFFLQVWFLMGWVFRDGLVVVFILLFNSVLWALCTSVICKMIFSVTVKWICSHHSLVWPRRLLCGYACSPIVLCELELVHLCALSKIKSRRMLSNDEFM